MAEATGRELTFADRVQAQEAIERVYYAHQIGATEPFEEAVPRNGDVPGAVERRTPPPTQEKFS